MTDDGKHDKLDEPPLLSRGAWIGIVLGIIFVVIIVTVVIS